MGYLLQVTGCQRFVDFWQLLKCLAYLRQKKSWRKINERFVRKFHSERKPICCGVSRRGVIHHVPFPYLFLWFMREMVGWGNHGCVFFVCAERDESRPYGWRMASDCVYLGWRGTWWITPLRLAHGGWLCFLLARNVINHAPTAGVWHLNNR